ncbi:MAG: flagellar basal body-associated FliL family protein [Cellulosilyticaceae bacterium]
MDKKFKVIIIIIIAVIGIGSISTVTFMFLNVQKKLDTVQTQAQQQDNQDVKNYNSEDLELIALKEAITSNIAEDESGVAHVAKVAIGFRVDTKAKDYKDVSDVLTNKQIIIRDEIIRILREQTYEMMTRTGENNAQDKLSTEILTKVNDLLGTTSIKEVRFGEFFVQ